MPPCLDDFPLNHHPLPSSDSLNNARPRRSAGIAGVALLLSSLGIAAAPISIPDAGQAVRDAQSQRLDLPAPMELDPEKPAPQDAGATDASAEGPRVRVDKFQVGGNRVFDSARLLALLADLEGHELSLPQLHAAAGRIGDFYQQHGYVLARAYLPAQEIENGTVRLEVVEGRYGQVELHNGSRTLDPVVRQPLANLESGTPVKGDELERSLLLLSDIPGVEAKGTLLPGQVPGTTDLRIDARTAPLFSGRLEADNFGDRAMGEYRLGGVFDLNGPLGLGDQLNLRLLGSDRHQRYYRAAYQLPLGPWGSRIGMAHSETSYRLVRDFKEWEAHGRAIIDSLFLTHPLLRSRAFNLSTQLQYEEKRLNDDIDLFEFKKSKQIHLWTAGFSGSSQDRLLGGGQTGFSLAYGHGRLNLDSGERSRDRKSAGTQGRFDKLSINAVRLQRLTDRLQLFTQLNAQWSSGNLDSAEKFDIGGAYGVRAFPSGTQGGTGDEGWQASAELRYSLAPGWQLSSFVDQGAVKFQKKPWTPEVNRNRMGGAGTGATWYGADHQVSLTAAWPLGQEKGIAPDRNPRLWLQATRYF
ncbi:TPA: ShlB/FhaC/HecB family hemolysin secretion/activation protein [Pseudomonas aeruginosa]|nr:MULTISPECIES: ShlB/FhaC/HecB family hemolysin secretion/activation protein [Pseudomonas]MBG5301641.1 ShlB/FhaC/HecB family hemolysin secretion/activation protein [Pseudomonas aeruginosa]MDI3650712.1 ShlB/FhaC/HecB family hemolysin secretion/activation protein [Pseudomonas aeruginosa]MDI3795627.1 ShlB/FhaC/HecB family hemolysin secretion/activation protein [Pseudomonas aeruginosa]RUE52656.1 ShlB/FhaC/HecB family hemolysin secretion/activation protein [Pseudomonas aeruginosa]WRH81224.1 ShlB/F